MQNRPHITFASRRTVIPIFYAVTIITMLAAALFGHYILDGSLIQILEMLISILVAQVCVTVVVIGICVCRIQAKLSNVTEGETLLSICRAQQFTFEDDITGSAKLEAFIFLLANAKFKKDWKINIDETQTKMPPGNQNGVKKHAASDPSNVVDEEETKEYLESSGAVMEDV